MSQSLPSPTRTGHHPPAADNAPPRRSKVTGAPAALAWCALPISSPRALTGTGGSSGCTGGG